MSACEVRVKTNQFDQMMLRLKYTAPEHVGPTRQNSLLYYCLMNRPPKNELQSILGWYWLALQAKYLTWCATYQIIHVLRKVQLD